MPLASMLLARSSLLVFTAGCLTAFACGSSDTNRKTHSDDLPDAGGGAAGASGGSTTGGTGASGGSGGANTSGSGGQAGSAGSGTGGTGGAAGSGGTLGTPDASVTTDASVDGSLADVEDAGTVIVPPQTLYHRGPLEALDTGTADRVASTDPDGVRALLDLPPLTPQHDISTFDVSADGRYIAVAAWGPENFDGGAWARTLRVWDTTDTSSSTLITVGDAAGAFDSVRFSPDGSRVAFVADLEGNDVHELYVTRADVADASGTTRRVSAPPSHVDQDVKPKFSWAPSELGPLIAFTTNPTSITSFGLFVVDTSESAIVDAVAPPPVRITTLAFQDFTSNPEPVLQWRNGQLYFTAIQTTQKLFRADPDGRNLELVPGADLSTPTQVRSVNTYSISPNGRWLAFVVGTPGEGNSEVHVLDLESSAPSATQISNYPSSVGAVRRGPRANTGMAWSPDSRSIAVVANWGPVSEPPGNDGLFLVYRSGATTRRLLTSPDGTLRALDVPSSPRWFNGGIGLLGDLVTDGRNDLYYVTDLASSDQDPAGVLFATAAAGGDIEQFLVVP